MCIHTHTHMPADRIVFCPVANLLSILCFDAEFKKEKEKKGSLWEIKISYFGGRF